MKMHYIYLNEPIRKKKQLKKANNEIDPYTIIEFCKVSSSAMNVVVIAADRDRSKHMPIPVVLMLVGYISEV